MNPYGPPPMDPSYDSRSTATVDTTATMTSGHVGFVNPYQQQRPQGTAGTYLGGPPPPMGYQSYLQQKPLMTGGPSAGYMHQHEAAAAQYQQNSAAMMSMVYRRAYQMQQPQQQATSGYSFHPQQYVQHQQAGGMLYGGPGYPAAAVPPAMLARRMQVPDSTHAQAGSTNSSNLRKFRKPPPRSGVNLTRPNEAATLPSARPQPSAAVLPKVKKRASPDDAGDWDAAGDEDYQQIAEEEDDDDDDYRPRIRRTVSNRSSGTRSQNPRRTVAASAYRQGDFPAPKPRKAPTVTWTGDDGEGDSVISASRASKKRKVGKGEDADWLGAPSSDDEEWTSDVDSEVVGSRSTSVRGGTSTRNRKRPSSRQWAEEETAGGGVNNSGYFSGLDDDDSSLTTSRRKQEVRILETPSATGPLILGVDKVVGHIDYVIEPETGEPIDEQQLEEVETSVMKEEGSNQVDNRPKERHYIIKWTGRSHLHNTSHSLEELQSINVSGIKKVTNYIKKQNDFATKKATMSDDEIEQLIIAQELQKQLDQDALIAERVIVHAKVQQHPGGADVTVYLVKWVSCPYDQSTWETHEFLNEHGFQALIDAYDARESRISGTLSSHHPLNQHDLSETSFEPYQSTPPFLGGSKCMTLRDYQLTGLNWIISRMKKDLSVLLADEMGLGKTAQTISVIGHMIYSERAAGPFLVVVPQSTMDNWLAEFQQWLPEANVVLYHGNPAARQIVRDGEIKIVHSAPMSRIAYEAFVQPKGRLTPMSTNSLRQVIANRLRYRCDVVITTTSILQCPEDLTHLRAIPWYLMAIDEAHQLKNRDSKRFKELCLFTPRYKLLLSGTPLHNNLEELWSLLHFMNPRIYSTLYPFQQKYSEVERTESVGELKARQLSQLERELREVVLRRVKKDVLKSLPNKIEWILRVELSPRQASLCQDVIVRNYEALAKSTGGSKFSLQNVCVELKKICNHPFLVRSKPVSIPGLLQLHCPEDRETFNKELLWSSGKMCLLDKLLARLKDKGHRVLIFSQMVRMLNLLSTFLTIRGFKHQRLDGTMSRDVRKKAMDHFNAPNSDDFCFLLSTKAGGLGINLTSADTVIIYDSDWNPQNDLQAEARAHRIGQTKTVQIYRVVTKDSVEEDILERAKAKMVLDALVVQGLNVKAGIGDTDLLNGTSTASSKSAGFSREELTTILKFGASKLWKKSTAKTEPTGQAPEEELKIDLDRVLAEAEQHTENSTSTGSGRAEDLLSSFQNVSDFRYEAPKAKDEDKLSWDSIIPLEDRLKFAPTTELAATVGGARKVGRASKRNSTNIGRELVAAAGELEEDDFKVGDEYGDSDESSDVPNRSRRRKGRKTAYGSMRSSRAAAVTNSKASASAALKSAAVSSKKKDAITDRDRYRLSRAMMKFGSPLLRMQEIKDDAKLGKIDETVVIEEAQSLLTRCEEALAASATGETNGTKKNTQLISISLGTGYTCPCQELLCRVQYLECLQGLIAAQNPGVQEPWKLPSNQLVLSLPEGAVIKSGDAALLKGICIHGFANWQKIATDAGLAEGQTDFASKVKSDKVKIRATRLLQFVQSMSLNQTVIEGQRVDEEAPRIFEVAACDEPSGSVLGLSREFESVNNEELMNPPPQSSSIAEDTSATSVPTQTGSVPVIAATPSDDMGTEGGINEIGKKIPKKRKDVVTDGEYEEGEASSSENPDELL